MQQQVDDDPGEPRGDEVAAEARADGDDEAGDDLDRADGVHDLVRAAGQEVGDLGREVAVPVDEHVGELVEAEEDRRDGEADPQQPERLERRVGEVGARRAGRRGRPVVGSVRSWSSVLPLYKQVILCL